MSYPGGKSNNGAFQQIISMMPPHDVYIEPFLGGGSVMLHKKPAAQSFGFDLNVDALGAFPADKIPNLTLRNENALAFLSSCWFGFNPNTLIYADPPYLQSVRRSSKRLYKYELREESEHIELLEILLKLPCMVMISGYESPLYDEMLSGWRKEHYTAYLRGARAVKETIWLNFPPPLELHDYSFLGNGFRERERIKRKKTRWKNILLKMDKYERFALMQTIAELKSDHSSPKSASRPTV